MNRQAQIRLTETIAVLFIFFILVGLGIIFYAQYQKVSMKEEQQELAGRKAIEVTLQALFLPELICSKGEAEPEENCVDLMKARKFDTLTPYFNDYYFDLFSYGRVVVHQLYPREERLVLYDKQNPQALFNQTSFFVVALKDDTAGGFLPAYGYGYLEVGVYS